MRSKKTESVREAIGIFHSADRMKEAIEDLFASGFELEELGLLASDNEVQQSLGVFYTRTNDDRDSSKTPAIAFIDSGSIGDAPRALGGSLLFIGGAILIAMVVTLAAVFGGGMLAAISALVGVGIVGVLALSFIRQSDAEYLRQQIDEGRMLLFVRMDAVREKQAMEILKEHSGQDVKMYKVPVNSRIEPNSPRAKHHHAAEIPHTA